VPRVTLEGVLRARKRAGRSTYVAYFTVLADGILVKSLGDRANNRKTVEISFARVLVIMGKSGPSGLRGSVRDGGAWLTVYMVPAAEERSLELRLPLRDEYISLKVRGPFDVSLVKICPSCGYKELLELHPQEDLPREPPAREQ